MRTAIVIPARLAATRLPNKPLAEINGEAMIVHVWRKAIEADIGDVIVACCSQKVATLIEAEGGKAILTDPDLPSGSDRIYAAIKAAGKAYDIIVNLQGDLPVIDIEVIRESVQPLLTNADVDIGTVAVEIKDDADKSNPNVVKIAIADDGKGKGGRALYFSRSLIPANAGVHYHHVGIYAYRMKALESFISLSPSPLEKREKLEQLRALEAGMRIDVRIVDQLPLTVDTEEDLEKVRACF